MAIFCDHKSENISLVAFSCTHDDHYSYYYYYYYIIIMTSTNKTYNNNFTWPAVKTWRLTCWFKLLRPHRWKYKEITFLLEQYLGTVGSFHVFTVRCIIICYLLPSPASAIMCVQAVDRSRGSSAVLPLPGSPNVSYTLYFVFYPRWNNNKKKIFK